MQIRVYSTEGEEEILGKLQVRSKSSAWCDRLWDKSQKSLLKRVFIKELHMLSVIIILTLATNKIWGEIPWNLILLKPPQLIDDFISWKALVNIILVNVLHIVFWQKEQIPIIASCLTENCPDVQTRLNVVSSKSIWKSAHRLMGGWGATNSYRLCKKLCKKARTVAILNHINLCSTKYRARV